jgi:hypothetical protein
MLEIDLDLDLFHTMTMAMFTTNYMIDVSWKP